MVGDKGKKININIILFNNNSCWKIKYFISIF